MTEEENDKLIKQYFSQGMRREGHLLENYLSKGEWVDEYHYSILQSEW